MDRQFFMDQFRASGLSQREVGRRLKLSSSQMVRLLDGERKLQLGEALELARTLNLSLSETLIHAGVESARSLLSCPVVGLLQDETGLIKPMPAGTAAMAIPPGDLNTEAVAIQARTAGTPLDWMDGWVLFCAAAEKAPDATSLGRFCLARLHDDRRVLATLRRGYADGTFNLCGLYRGDSEAVKAVQPVLITRHP